MRTKDLLPLSIALLIAYFICGCSVVSPSYRYNTECSDTNYLELVNLVQSGMLDEDEFISAVKSDGMITIHEYEELANSFEGDLKAAKFRKIFDESNTPSSSGSDCNRASP